MSPDQAASEVLLAVDELRTSFHTSRGVVRAVDGVSFALRAGRSLGLVGESGSGKSALLRSIMGLLPADGVERSGHVRFGGRELTSLPRRELRGIWGRDMSVVFQDPLSALNPVVRIGRQLTEGLRAQFRLPKREAVSKVIELLDTMGIAEPSMQMRRYPHELSGGMRQRILIASALACGPKLLLADEPVTGLDVTVQKQVLDLVEAERRRRSMGMILVSHDLAIVAGRTDSVAVMYAGRIVEIAPTETLFTQTRMPYTQSLIDVMPKLDAPAHSRLSAIPGTPPDPANLPDGCRFAPRCPYAQERCTQQEPPLRTAGTGHLFACWFPLGSPLS